MKLLLIKSNVHASCVKLNIGDVSDKANTNAIPNNAMGLKDSAKLEGPSEGVDGGRTLSRNSLVASEPRDTMKQIGEPVKEDLMNIGNCMASLFRESWTTFCSYLKSQSHFSMMLLIMFISILVMMQVCTLSNSVFISL